MDWRILEVPVRSSKYRRNVNNNPLVNKVLSAKRADGLARMWQSQEEIFIYEQTGPPGFDDITEFYIHDYKLARTMRDVLNQRIILRLNSGTNDYDNLASFGALAYRTEVSLLCFIRGNNNMHEIFKDYQSLYAELNLVQKSNIGDVAIADITKDSQFIDFILGNKQNYQGNSKSLSNTGTNISAIVGGVIGSLIFVGTLVAAGFIL
ncbi:6928_t:CDS:2, partial [Racocetra persica]